MKTRCPHCKQVQDIPDPYRLRQVKCLVCRKDFVAAMYVPPPPMPRLDSARQVTNELWQPKEGFLPACFIICGMLSILCSFIVFPLIPELAFQIFAFGLIFFAVGDFISHYRLQSDLLREIMHLVKLRTPDDDSVIKNYSAPEKKLIDMAPPADTMKE